MQYVQYALQIVAGIGILNVWLLRFGKRTPYRGGGAENMQQEFAYYGLPNGSVYLVGFLKIISALGLLGGLFLEPIVRPSALLLSVLMMGAILMHLKVKDPAIKFAPATGMLVISLLIAWLAS